jgi:3-phenylpropionate/trans-cinnamate dioxygenase ferredoxin reductase subunit
MPRTAVVLGANLAGGRAAETLRTEGFDGRVVLVGAEPDLPYERPPLSKEMLRGESGPVFLRDEAFYHDNQIELRLGVRATKLDPSGSVELADGSTIDFDMCLVATGARVREMSGEGVRYLRTMQDAQEIAKALEAKPRVVVVGAGFIGAEVAASARTTGCDVTMIEMLPVPLQRVLGDDIGMVYADIHRDHGVDLRLSEGVERFEAGVVVGSSGTRYEADLVVVGVGVVPNVELAQDAGITCDNGIVVDEMCRTSAEKVYAAGDVAKRPDPWSGKSIRIEHFQNAQNQGPAAARSMLGKGEPFSEVPWFWSDQYDVNLQMLGHTSPDADRVIRGSLESRDFIAFYLNGDRVVAATALNRGRDISAARRLIERRVSVDHARLRDETVALKDLLRG